MEVHHHPHVEKKSFKEYLLEGLMIFVAVTMGFFAETVREGINEHQRAKVFAAAMIKDLEGDTAALAPYITYFTYARNNTDTLMQLLTSAEPKDIPTGKLYWYGLFGGAHRFFIPNDATFQQMKSSGTINYFEKSVAAEVSKYDRLCRVMEDYESNGRAIYDEVRICRAKLFNFVYNDKANSVAQAIYVKFDRGRIEDFMASNPPLLSYDKILFNEYVEMIRSRTLYLNVNRAKDLLAEATLLVRQLKDTYDLGDQ